MLQDGSIQGRELRSCQLRRKQFVPVAHTWMRASWSMGCSPLSSETVLPAMLVQSRGQKDEEFELFTNVVGGRLEFREKFTV
jgi:hypothetical protein